MQTESAAPLVFRSARSSALSRLALVLVVALGALPNTACVRYRAPPQVPLSYRAPSDTPDSFRRLEIPAGTKIHVAKIVDDRPDTKTIGENVEKKDRPVPVYALERSPPAFLDDVLSKELARAGFVVVERPDDATAVLAVTLSKFFVTEAESYQAEISAKVELRDKAGKVLFGGPITGSKSQWGKSLSAQNYQEVLSKAALDFVGSLAGNPAFKKAIAGK